MNLAPRVETAEISDADLDNVSGGMAGGAPADAGAPLGLGAAAGFYAEAGPLGVGGGLGAAVTPEGVAADLNLHVAKY